MVKIKAFKYMSVFLNLHACQPVVGGLLNPKYEPFITHNRGTLSLVIRK